jgi:hypothetical protein
MPTAHPDGVKHQFARWIASGGTVASWCRESGVPVPTAYRWYRADGFRRLIARYRRPMVDRAIDEMARSLGRAVAALDERIERGPTDADKLAAARALIDGMLDAGPEAGARRLATRPDR